ncbi:adenylate cyclase type 2-like [Drosophila serrata]|uniref:adenylate cyclase type 2-like n=1 Tax=Drosophila serrata TaxID=7274 RepID=UPI000A1D0AE1|nr:adenylate cyclase type 2-like [Drosophila serrata]
MAQEDPVLQKYPMRTYLVAGTVYNRSRKSPITVNRGQSAINIRTRPMQGPVDISDSMYEELREEFRKMPVGGYDFQRIFSSKRRVGDTARKSRREIGFLCTQFKDATLERNYLHQPDYTFKGSVLLAWVTGVCLIYIEIMTNVCWDCIAINMVTFIVLTSLLFIAWYKKLCWWKNGNRTGLEYNRISCFIFKVYERIQRSLFLRIFCYLVTIACYHSVILLIVSNCDRSRFELEYIESKLFHYEVNLDTCFHTWSFTNMTALILGMSYTFSRIPFAVKTCVSCIEAIIYLLILFFEYQFVFQHSNTTAPFLPPEVAHCARIMFMLITLYVKERQVEFNAKTNYRLNVSLKNKQNMANATNQSILILLNNILPSHVVTHYLDSLAKHELYYENYKMVSVMFAKLMNFRMDLPTLRVLNCIISEFDALLIHYKKVYMVEKIKVVGCTYMAACGLDFSLASMVRKGSSVRISRFMERARNSRFLTEEDEDDSQDTVVFLMTTFALDLMRTLASCNKAYAEAPFDRYLSSTQIGIGISSGEVMAGVVGASQPHYDIWGNPVNMASRMQSTGLPGHIQVTEESAKILMNFGIKCNLRGLTFVKGRGEIPTYFVAFDEKLHFISNETEGTSPVTRFSNLDSLDEDVESSSSFIEIIL